MFTLVRLYTLYKYTVRLRIILIEPEQHRSGGKASGPGFHNLVYRNFAEYHLINSFHLAFQEINLI
jgi:hypothetical protein